MENLTLETFKEKIFDFTNDSKFKYKGDKPAIIDYFASWCKPCQTIAPILEDLSKEYPDIDFYKVNIEDESEITSESKIRSIPSILFIPIKGEPQMIIGALPKIKLIELISNTFNIDRK